MGFLAARKRAPCIAIRVIVTGLLSSRAPFSSHTEKNGFVTATKLWTTNIFFVSATKRFVDRTKHFDVTKYFCYP